MNCIRRLIFLQNINDIAANIEKIYDMAIIRQIMVFLNPAEVTNWYCQVKLHLKYVMMVPLVLFGASVRW